MTGSTRFGFAAALVALMVVGSACVSDEFSVSVLGQGEFPESRAARLVDPVFDEANATLLNGLGPPDDIRNWRWTGTGCDASGIRIRTWDGVDPDEAQRALTLLNGQWESTAGELATVDGGRFRVVLRMPSFEVSATFRDGVEPGDNIMLLRADVKAGCGVG